MNRNYIHDIKPSSRTQKRREALDHEHELRMRKMGLSKSVREEREEESAYRNYSDSSSGRSGRGIWYVAAFAIVVLVLALTYVFASAEVVVTPRQGTVELTGPLVADKISRTGLTFQMMVVEDVASAEVASSGETYIEKKAIGTVRLFNNNPTAQKLLIDTRLTSSEGKIYKTKTATTIPGNKIVSGKSVPGTVDVGLYADEAGDSYNLAKDVDLKVLGFKGGPKYTTVYGKTLTEISGGFKGQSSNISEEDLKTKTENLKGDLTKSLYEKAKAQLPESFVFYEKSSLIDFDEPIVETATDGTTATIKVAGTMNAIIFKESELTKALVSGVVSEEDREKVRVSNIRDLNIELDKATAIGDPTTMESIKITINDKINVVWDIDEDGLTKALSGIRKKDFESKMIQFKNIDKAELDLKPFWKNRLPEKTEDIKITNALEIEV
jgi:hypothetical protein